VWISAAEVAAMAQHLGLPVADFEARHCQPYSGVTGWRLLQSKFVDAPQQQQQHSPSMPVEGGQQQQQQEVGPRRSSAGLFSCFVEACAVKDRHTLHSYFVPSKAYINNKGP
jgi:hypothetical protein